MKKDYDFVMFIDEHGDIFSEYLSHICTTGYVTDRYKELEEKLGKIFDEYPEIAAIIDMDKPKELTEVECEKLIELLHVRNAIDDIGVKEVYFQGCMDCVKYLKMMNLLAEVQEVEISNFSSDYDLR